jgi:hypothetical protein
MLSQIVRPLVETQIRLLANSENTRSTLIETIIRWLGYLGVRAEITDLKKDGERVQINLKVDRPENCQSRDWQKILYNLVLEKEEVSFSMFEKMTESQQIKIARTLAYMLQAGGAPQEVEKPLRRLKIDENLLLMVKSALKVPQSSQIIEKLEGDVAAYIFPLAVQLSWFDNKVTTQENEALTYLLKVIENPQTE